MTDLPLPAQFLVYAGASATISNLLVNGIRMAVRLTPLMSLMLAMTFGFALILLFSVANSVPVTPELLASSVILGILVGATSAAQNAVHERAMPTAQKGDGRWN